MRGRDLPTDAEFGRPQWMFGTATWAFAGPSRMVVSPTRGTAAGISRRRRRDRRAGAVSPTDLEPHDGWRPPRRTPCSVAGSATQPDAVVRVDLAPVRSRRSRRPRRWRSTPAISRFPRRSSFQPPAALTAHAFYYPPRNRDFAAPAGERPPLIVISHGGPTTAHERDARSGGAVLDQPRLRGGRRELRRQLRLRPRVPRALNGQWGIVDVEDVVGAARYSSRPGQADRDRLIIRGGSAGGYTTLAALTFHPGVFKAGASYYGISDLEVLARDTHKFESRYLDTLIGPYPGSAGPLLARVADSLRRPAVVSAHPVPGTRRQGRAAESVGDDGGRGAGEGAAGRLSGLRRRAARLPQGGDDRPHASRPNCISTARCSDSRQRTRSSRCGSTTWGILSPAMNRSSTTWSRTTPERRAPFRAAHIPWPVASRDRSGGFAILRTRCSRLVAGGRERMRPANCVSGGITCDAERHAGRPTGSNCRA